MINNNGSSLSLHKYCLQLTISSSPRNTTKFVMALKENKNVLLMNGKGCGQYAQNSL